MLSRRDGVWALTALLAICFSTLLGCKEEIPEGRIDPDKVNLKIGENAALELVLRSKHEGVQREIWKVEPETLGDIYYDQAALKRRSATFRANASGEGKVVVFGFLNSQTPHRIAEVPITVE